MIRRFVGSCESSIQTRDAIDAADPKAAIFVTRRAAMDEILKTRVGRTRRIFFLQGLVPSVPPAFTEMEVDGAIVGSGLDLAYTDRCRIEPEKVHVTGYPDYDGYSRLDQGECRRQLEAAYPQAAGRKVVVFTSQYATAGFPNSARLHNLRTVIETARRMPNVYFLLKPHPLRESVPSTIVDELPDNVALGPDFNTVVSLKAADVAVTFWSTTALEAILLGTPLVQLNATGLPDFLDLSTQLGREVARSSQSLASLIQQSFDAGPRGFLTQRERFLLHHGIRLDGKSAERAARAIVEEVDRARFPSVQSRTLCAVSAVPVRPDLSKAS